MHNEEIMNQKQLCKHLLKLIKNEKYLFIDPQKYIFEDVYLILLFKPGNDPKSFDYSKKTRKGVMPIYFNKHGLILPFRCVVSDFKHIYNNPTKFYMIILQRYIKNLKIDLDFLLKTTLSKVSNYQIPCTTLIPHHGGNFGHQLCVYLSLYSYLIPNISNYSNTNLLYYPTYKHINQIRDLIIDEKEMNISIDLNLKLNQFYHFKELRFIPSRMNAFPSEEHRFILDYLKTKVYSRYIKESIEIPTITENISILKTNNNLTHAGNRLSGSFTFQLSKQLLEDQNYRLLDHEKIHISEILFYLYNAKKIILSWGAIAYYNIFLMNHQQCLIVIHPNYMYQLKKFGDLVCMNPKLFKNYKIRKCKFELTPLDISN